VVFKGFLKSFFCCRLLNKFHVGLLAPLNYAITTGAAASKHFHLCSAQNIFELSHKSARYHHTIIEVDNDELVGCDLSLIAVL